MDFSSIINGAIQVLANVTGLNLERFKQNNRTDMVSRKTSANAQAAVDEVNNDVSAGKTGGTDEINKVRQDITP